jgi:hypothetical protein
MSTVCLAELPRSRSPRIVWVCDRCAIAGTTFGPAAWAGPAGRREQPRSSDLVRNLCPACANIAAPRRF